MNYQKKIRVVLSVFIIWIILIFFITLPWIHQFDRKNCTLSILAHLSASIWWIVLLWAFHHLSFQLISIFRNKKSHPPLNIDQPHIVILYTTCDDFNENSCLSCIKQDYPNFKVLVCDDSTKEIYKKKIDEFCLNYYDKCRLIRRTNKKGFKAGNLNYAIETVSEEWILLVDADQQLSLTFLSELVKRIPIENLNIAFIQAAHKALLNEESTIFQYSLATEVSLYYGRDMSARETYGFVPLLGHGSLIRKSSWKKIGGFPERVSEDFAYAIKASIFNQHGIYIEEVESQEAVPYNFNAFIIRLKKFASGTAELFRTEILPFLRGPAKLVEKWDFLVSLSWYILMPLVTINGFLAAYVVHKLWKESVPYLHPAYPYLYIGLILIILSIQFSVAQNVTKTLRFYFWSTAIYSSVMPLAGLRFIKHLFPFFPAIFERTPKREEEECLNKINSIIMVLIGLIAIILAFIWLSPFSPFLAGQGVSYISYPLYGKLCSSSFTAKLSRLIIYLPGLLMLFAIYTMLEWGRF